MSRSSANHDLEQSAARGGVEKQNGDANGDIPNMSHFSKTGLPALEAWTIKEGLLNALVRFSCRFCECTLRG
ncbi:hypothetical protein TcWFU_005524 [Taenia crassiceps]|uniref:Uncharacterized protein n=1 Tax=Taenia crassiceps TaxID=6207 RepID=A0ABR4Q675_9CEST